MTSFFCSGKRSKSAKIEKPARTNPTFFVFKILVPQEVICCENLEDFTEGNSRKSQVKP